MSVTQIDPDKLIETMSLLSQRIKERFPDSSIHQVSVQLLKIAHQARRRTKEVAQPIYLLRSISLFLMALIILVVFAGIFAVFDQGIATLSFLDVAHGFQVVISDFVYIAISLIFIYSLEVRMKRRKAMVAFSELRNLAHVIDAIQLNKSPSLLYGQEYKTASSPVSTMSKYEVERYLDYCSEMLSIVGKVSILYLQALDDHVTLNVVNEIENLTTGLSNKIWQKSILFSLTNYNK